MMHRVTLTAVVCTELALTAMRLNTEHGVSRDCGGVQK
jgi:hypothetical protein